MRLDLEGLEKAVRAKQAQLEGLPVAPWTAYTIGRSSGLSLAMSLLREHLTEDK